MQNIKFYYSSVDIIINEFKTIKNKKLKSEINFNEKLNFLDKIELKEISFSYDGKKQI